MSIKIAPTITGCLLYLIVLPWFSIVPIQFDWLINVAIIFNNHRSPTDLFVSFMNEYRNCLMVLLFSNLIHWLKLPLHLIITDIQWIYQFYDQKYELLLFYCSFQIMICLIFMELIDLASVIKSPDISRPSVIQSLKSIIYNIYNTASKFNSTVKCLTKQRKGTFSKWESECNQGLWRRKKQAQVNNCWLNSLVPVKVRSSKQSNIRQSKRCFLKTTLHQVRNVYAYVWTVMNWKL